MTYRRIYRHRYVPWLPQSGPEQCLICGCRRRPRWLIFARHHLKEHR